MQHVLKLKPLPNFKLTQTAQAELYMNNSKINF